MGEVPKAAIFEQHSQVDLAHYIIGYFQLTFHPEVLKVDHKLNFIITGIDSQV